MTEQRMQNELVLSPGSYAYTQDLTSGVLKTHTGPSVVNVTGQEYPVSFDARTGLFKKVPLSDASQQFITAQQGQYIVLANPSTDDKQPQVKDKAVAPSLNYGQKVIIQGPKTFALWPGQSAEVIDGHNLRSNQYLVIRIRDEEQARTNWMKGVIKSTGTIDSGTSDDPKASSLAKKTTARTASLFDKVPDDLSVGRQYIVRGDEFSFYIPPTGVEVLKDDAGSYVRDAVTLERLEYCILIDENGSKRYERGPDVVFPLPSEKFHEETDKAGNRHVVFQPIELNEIQGIHVKVIADYEEDDGTKRKEGEELFIKGDKTPIYFPRAEHSLVTYDRKHKSFATAIPAGEGRYVLQRRTGMINMVKGPAMLLPDPRSEVIVRRVLSDKQCKLWYPGNLEAERYNSALRELSRGTSSTRGAVSEGEVERSKKIKAGNAGYASSVLGFADRSTTHSETYAVGAEEFERSASYTEPRTLTLDTKFSGVPTIDIWQGFAVMVVTVRDDAETKRRVEIGPRRVMLEYDETLQALSMSTGKPKSTDNLIQTVYLRIKNNQISDVMTAETKDHVNVSFKVSLRGDFTGDDPTRWFEAENYVKLVSDHVRSIVKAAVRQRTIEELYADPTSVIRDAVLGQKAENGRPGLMFEENGFKLSEVELLGFTVGDEKISQILDETQHQVVKSNIGLAMAEKKLTLDKRQEELEREREEAKAETQRIKLQLQAEVEKFNAVLATEKVTRERDLALERLKSQLDQLKAQQDHSAAQQKLLDEQAAAELARAKAKADQDLMVQTALQDLALAKTREETKAVVEKFTAAAGPVADAIIASANQKTLVEIAQAQNLAHAIGGASFADALQKAFQGTPIETALQVVKAKAAPATKNGSSTSA